MTHTEALNLLLAHACPSETLWSHALNKDVYYFRIDVHCQSFEVEATLASTFQTIQYDIHAVTAVQ